MSRLRAWLERAGSLIRRVVGAPDYDAYLAHARAAHGDAVPLSREEFFTQRLKERYDKPGSRCC